MKNKVFISFLITFFIFVLIIFYKALSNTNFYIPAIDQKRNIPQFSAPTFFDKKIIQSKDIFFEDKFYLLNIWSSWCVPCKEEHLFLMNLSKNEKIEIIGFNYKDKFKNADKFINKLGNPYTKILIDRDGTKAIELGAFGVPETFLIYKNQIIKKFIGPLNSKLIKEIEIIIK